MRIPRSMELRTAFGELAVNGQDVAVQAVRKASEGTGACVACNNPLQVRAGGAC